MKYTTLLLILCCSCGNYAPREVNQPYPAVEIGRESCIGARLMLVECQGHRFCVAQDSGHLAICEVTDASKIKLESPFK